MLANTKQPSSTANNHILTNCFNLQTGEIIKTHHAYNCLKTSPQAIKSNIQKLQSNVKM